jgi:hypothetical protein
MRRADTIVSAHGALSAVGRWLVMTGAAAVLLAGRSPALAAPINYGSHVGTDVTYVDVTEDPGAAPLPLFGTPIFTANSIDFNPVGFDATSGPAGGIETTAGNLAFMVVAHSGAHIGSIAFSESGDTTLAGNAPPASIGTATAVSASGTVTVQEVDFAAITPIVRPFALAFTPSGGTYSLGVDGGGLPIFHTQWSGSVTVNLDQILTQAGVPFSSGTTKISIDMNNTLTATSESGTSAHIVKSDFGGIAIAARVGRVPEPTALSLAGLGLLALMRGRRLRDR